ncbi:glycoside hydrolase family 18 [Dysgonomonas sp. 511]|uniref:glycoside hydrolase family 18 n=1 Tax=Dysgonomonas sp. 511 TaxID=2302930 RepID=UPI0013D647DE|nr:glycoside hydrolase family 18 [Dysgonomonas sp. 511]NDV79303.1 hypothetical protein [Dysgonomonas sp. 511]
MKNYLKYSLFVVIASMLGLAFNSCDDWTDPESLDLKNPTLEDSNPQLYADYLKNLRDYKAGEHNAIFVSFDNPKTIPMKQAERLTALPDSVDFICLNNPDNLNSVTQEEMVKVENDKGTRVLYVIDYNGFEADWQAMEKANPKLTEEDALQYLGGQIDAALALCDKYSYHGIVVDYTGRSLVSLTEPALALYNARQQNLFDRVMAWRETHKGKTLVLYSNIQYLVPENMDMLEEYDYLVIKSASSTNADDLSVKTYLAVQAGKDAVLGVEGGINPVPTDRFLACVQLPQADDKDKIIGYWNTLTGDNEKTIAALGAAQWVTQESPDFSRKGLFVMNVHNDYYNRTYGYVRDIIRIMNPNK